MQQPWQFVGLLSVHWLDTERDLVCWGELAAFRQGLNEGGYVEGRNLTGLRSCSPSSERDCHHGGIPSALAAKSATTTIPIVFQMGVDPVEMGLIASLSRPGGNITGCLLDAGAWGPKAAFTWLATQPYSATEVDGWQHKAQSGVLRPGRSTSPRSA